MVKAIRVVEVCTSDIGVGAHQSEPKVRERKSNKVLSFSLLTHIFTQSKFNFRFANHERHS